MKNFKTKHLLSFSITVCILTLGFRFLGSSFFNYEMFSEISIFNVKIHWIWILSSLYFILMMYTGFFFGKKDYNTLPLIGLGFRYNLVSFLIFHLVSLSFFEFNLQSKYQSVEELKYSSIFWGISVLIHFYIFYKSKNKIINEINKEDLFD